jgi:cation diffusion facilitator family transporter
MAAAKSFQASSRKIRTEADRKFRVALLSIGSNTILVLSKLAVGFLTSSVSVLSEAIHSGMDLLAAVIAAYAVRRASHPPDPDHHFGHGKFENISGVLEALLIFCAAGYIVWEAVGKLLKGGELVHLEAGLGVMAISAVVNVVVSKRLYRVARETDSIALEADALHLRTDVYTSSGVLLALGLIYLTDLLVRDPQANARFHALDPLVAIGVAFMIFRAAYDLTKRSAAGLVDRPLPEEEDLIIRDVLQRCSAQCVEFHDLRHRKSGSERHIDLHLVVAKDTTVGEVHALCDKMEEEIERSLPRAKILIHVEPCSESCPNCDAQKTCEASGKMIHSPRPS